MKTYALLILLYFSSSVSQAAQLLKFADMKMLSQKTTAQDVYKEAINIAPNFGLSQSDEGLKAYFDPKTGESNLCAVTSIAHLLIYKMGITKELPVSAHVPGVSADLQSIDANELIIDLFKRCKTDVQKGTVVRDQLVCIGTAISDYFGKMSTIEYISDDEFTQEIPSSVQFFKRPPNLSDLRVAIKKGEPVLTGVAFNSVNRKENQWEFENRHKFVTYGFESLSAVDREMVILNMNPIWEWSGVKKTTSAYDLAIAFQRYEGSEVVLDGAGFSGQDDRAFLDGLIMVHVNQ